MEVCSHQIGNRHLLLVVLVVVSLSYADQSPFVFLDMLVGLIHEILVLVEVLKQVVVVLLQVQDKLLVVLAGLLGAVDEVLVAEDGVLVGVAEAAV